VKERALLVDKEVAHDFGVSLHTLRAARTARRDGRLAAPTFIRLPNGRIRYRAEDVLAFLRARGLLREG
jgi:hypothetical protein